MTLYILGSELLTLRSCIDSYLLVWPSHYFICDLTSLNKYKLIFLKRRNMGADRTHMFSTRTPCIFPLILSHSPGETWFTVRCKLAWTIEPSANPPPPINLPKWCHLSSASCLSLLLSILTWKGLYPEVLTANGDKPVLASSRTFHHLITWGWVSSGLAYSWWGNSSNWSICRIGECNGATADPP